MRLREVTEMSIGLEWCGGIFDGEGHGRVQNIDGHFYAHIEIDNTQISILEKFKEIVGLGSVRLHKRKRGKHKASFRYSATCKNAYKVAQMILPYVVSEQKRNQLLKILKYQKV